MSRLSLCSERYTSREEKLRKKKKESMKKRQAIQEDYKDVVRLYRKEMRRAKAQLELNLSTTIKGNKNITT